MQHRLNTITDHSTSKPALSSFSVIDRLIKKVPSPTNEIKQSSDSFQSESIEHSRRYKPITYNKSSILAAQRNIANKAIPTEKTKEIDPSFRIEGTYDLSGNIKTTELGSGRYWANKEPLRIDFEIGKYKGFFLNHREAIIQDMDTKDYYKVEASVVHDTFSFSNFQKLDLSQTKPAEEVKEIPSERPKEQSQEITGVYGNGLAETNDGIKGQYWANKEYNRIDFELGAYRGYFINYREALLLNKDTGETFKVRIDLQGNSFRIHDFEPIDKSRFVV